MRKWYQRRDLNPRPKAYESSALPLSYSGAILAKANTIAGRGQFEKNSASENDPLAEQKKCYLASPS